MRILTSCIRARERPAQLDVGGDKLRPDTDWELVTVLFPRRSCVSLTLIDGLVMRRRYRGRWQYRELSDEMKKARDLEHRA